MDDTYPSFSVAAPPNLGRHDQEAAGAIGFGKMILIRARIGSDLSQANETAGGLDKAIFNGAPKAIAPAVSTFTFSNASLCHAS
ncbi:hypothetical protein [Sulfitobacter geojensis]|uniref:hypothetical protein n=1 Tax=Sulfitobacter geojensis TaxID=1342299 RepID=UPI0004681958|nr:hypothetical protein [Sulfitobacter geojensis]KHA54088.1 hypothetical protein Z947_117 [Sulfitobacter geojensis]NYI29906.1 hypothetical protein [Sulfitobacter geojensis]